MRHMIIMAYENITLPLIIHIVVVQWSNTHIIQIWMNLNPIVKKPFALLKPIQSIGSHRREVGSSWTYCPKSVSYLKGLSIGDWLRSIRRCQGWLHTLRFNQWDQREELFCAMTNGCDTVLLHHCWEHKSLPVEDVNFLLKVKELRRSRASVMKGMFLLYPFTRNFTVFRRWSPLALASPRERP